MTHGLDLGTPPCLMATFGKQRAKSVVARTDREPGGQSDVQGLVVRSDQLLPHEEDWGDIQGIGHALMDDHEDDGGIPPAIHRHCSIYVTCTHAATVHSTLAASDMSVLYRHA